MFSPVGLKYTQPGFAGLEAARQRFRFVVVGYVVMPEHVHLLMSETGLVDPSVVMKWVKYRVARRALSSHTSRLRTEASASIRRRDVWGTQPLINPLNQSLDDEHFWQHRFYDFHVFTTKKVQEKLDYMHMNPVERGLVASPELWTWSSYRYYALGESSPVRFNAGWPIIQKFTQK